MTHRLIIRPEAEADLKDGKAWYDEQLAGLGDEFVACVEETILRVHRTPEMHQVIHKTKARKSLVRRFPYAVYYVSEADRVVVFAVTHTSRNPKIWRGRI
jgi:plasmid stabilization system protein ParE